jgi:hypothetical protein
VREINPREQQHEIAAAHRDGIAVVLGRPGKRPALKPLVQDPEPAVIPRQYLQSIATAIAEQKEMAGQWIEIEGIASPWPVWATV